MPTGSQRYLAAFLCLALLAGFTVSAAEKKGDADLNDALVAAKELLDKASNSQTMIGRRDVGEVFRIFSPLIITEDSDAKQAVVIFGDGKVDGNVRNELVVFWGDLELNGAVGGKCTVVFGSLTLGPDADLKSDTTIIGGKLNRAPGAKMGKEPYSFGGDASEWSVANWTTDWFKYGFFFARPLAPSVPLSWYVAALFFLTYAFLSALFPKPVFNCAQTLRSRPASAFVTGLLLPIPLLLVSLIFAATGIGAIVVPFLFLAVLFAAFLGKASVLQFAGQRVAELFRASGFNSPWAALIVGGGIFCLMYMVPIVGLVVWLLSLMFAVGAVMLTAVDHLRDEGSLTIRRKKEEKPRPVLEIEPGNEATYPPAGFWARLCATVLDWFLVGIVAAITFALPFFLLFLMAYYIAMWTWKGTTVGGIVMNQKLVRDDGKPMDFSAALIRSLASIFSFVMMGLGFAWVGWSREKKSWHDSIAGTNIVIMPREAREL